MAGLFPRTSWSRAASAALASRFPAGGRLAPRESWPSWRCSPGSPPATRSEAGGWSRQDRVEGTRGQRPPGPVLTQEPGTCSTPVGKDLELGIPVTNMSAETVLLRSARPVAAPACSGCCPGTGPRAALTLRVSSRAPVALGPGETTWLTATVRPLVSLPGRVPSAVPGHLLGERAEVLGHAAGLRRPRRRPLRRLHGPLTRRGVWARLAWLSVSRTDCCTCAGTKILRPPRHWLCCPPLLRQLYRTRG